MNRSNVKKSCYLIKVLKLDQLYGNKDKNNVKICNRIPPPRSHSCHIESQEA